MADTLDNDVFQPSADCAAGENGALLNPQHALAQRPSLRSSLVKDGSRRNSPARKTVSFTSTPAEKKVSNVNECLTHMQTGGEFTKIRMNARQYRRHFSLDADCASLRWTPTNKKPHKAKISVDQIKEIRVGRNTEALRSAEVCPNDVQDECVFSIIYGDLYECLDLVASGADEANIWVTGLIALTSGNRLDACGGADVIDDNCASTSSNSAIRERWLSLKFDDVDSERRGFAPDKVVGKLVKQLNPRVFANRVRHKIKEVDSSKPEEQRGQITKAEFIEIYKDVSTRPEIYFLMVRYANKDYLTWEDLQLFLETEQGMASVTQDLCQNIIQRHEPSEEGRQRNFMSVDGFTSYLLSDDCSLFDGSQRVVCQDMGRPLNQYFIAASNNTYLVEDQLKGPSSVDGYISALKRGCRFLELDVWEGEDGTEPVVYHGHTLTSKLPLSKALKAIREYAFEATIYPLFVRVEQHLLVESQAILAQKLVEFFGDKLHRSGEKDAADDMPSPSSLRGKVLIVGKRLDGDGGEGEVTDDDESAEANRRASKRQHERKALLCKQLSDLTCPFLVSSQLRELPSTRPTAQHQVHSVNESHCLRLAHAAPDEFSAFSRRHFTRVYPNAVRVDSSNMNPQEFWNFGAQIVALNYQTPGLMMDLQDGKFSANGGCGFVLKPPLMRDELSMFTPRENVPSALAPQILHLKIVSAQQLQRPRGSTAKGDSADPFVVVELFGVPSDCAEERTKTVKNDSFNPTFDESFQFQVSVPELALVRFLVLDDDYIGDDFIGQYTIPFDCLQSGYRHVTLLNNEGEPLDNSTLFVHVAVTNKRGGGKPRKRGMSVKRKHQRIHTGVKMVGLKHVDELFKNAVVSLAECIQLRNGLEASVVEWQESCGLGPAGTMRQGLRLLHSRVTTAALNKDLTAADSTSDGVEAAPAMQVFDDESGYARVELIGVGAPEQLRKTFAALDKLLSSCRGVLDKTEPLLQKLEEATRRIAESYEELSSLCSEAGLRGQKAVRATENFAWNLRLLKVQRDLTHKMQQEARSMLQQVADTGCVLGILRDKCQQPCGHQSSPRPVALS